jgi:hypothetical protein
MSKQTPGNVHLYEISIIGGNNEYIPLNNSMLELTLFEDIYSSGMYGVVSVLDASGILSKLKFIGEDLLNIHFDVPGINSPIKKTFRCYKCADRTFKNGNVSEVFNLHFVSPEVFMDHHVPVQKAFSGLTEDIVAELFSDYIIHPRYVNFDGESLDWESGYTELSLFTESKQIVKFVSPTWSPMKCISWLAAKTKPTGTGLSLPNTLFFESNKRFYWASVEDMIKSQYESRNIAGVYIYAPGNTKVSIPGMNNNTT